jgi:hypothetical protein
MTPYTKTPTNRGYAILFAVLLVSIILAIALGILNIALKEYNFTATAKNSHVGFFAADTGGECALFARKNGMLNGVSLSNPPSMTCDVQNVSSIATDLGSGITRFDFSPIQVQDGCALVDVTIDNSSGQFTRTTINSHGYNVICSDLNSNPRNKVERLLSYEFTELPGGGGAGTTAGTTGNLFGNPIGPNLGSDPLGGLGSSNLGKFDPDSLSMPAQLPSGSTTANQMPISPGGN